MQSAFSLLFSVILALSLLGCGGGGEEVEIPDKPVPPPTTSPKKIGY